jgi:FKBP-type peptidyl-prolyl cis-trans isomerase FklB
MLRSLLLVLLLPFLGLASPQQEGIDYLAENAGKPDVVTLPSGLQYKVLKKGDGKHHPTLDSPGLWLYEGRLISGDVFDGNYGGEPSEFAPNQVIAGWTEAMQLMVEGDKWELYIPTELAYGESGVGEMIPGGSALIFIMELVEILGDKVPVLTCDVVSGDGCNDKELKYVAKMKLKSIADQKKELHRLSGMVGQKMTADLKDWVKRRVYALSLLTRLAEKQPNDQEL